MNSILHPQKNNSKSKCSSIVTIRLLKKDKIAAQRAAKFFKVSQARLYRESLWKFSETYDSFMNAGDDFDLIRTFDPLKGSFLLEDSTATIMFTFRLPDKEREEAELMAHIHQCSISSVVRAGLMMILPITDEMMNQQTGPKLFRL